MSTPAIESDRAGSRSRIAVSFESKKRFEERLDRMKIVMLTLREMVLVKITQNLILRSNDHVS
jgi:hypothetical protein